MNNEKVDCPQCDGEGNHGKDDEGFMYLCYACHGTGKMTTLEAQDYENESNS